MMETKRFSPRLDPGKSTVHVWRIALDSNAGSHAVPSSFLSIHETEQANRFHFERDRRRYAAAHNALRIILSRYLNCRPEQVEYLFTGNGKPILAQDENLHFNLSHSHAMALVAVTRAGAVGVDIEHIRPLDDMDSLAKSCFSAQEYAEFHALSAPENKLAFFTCWTRKEAYIKALGEGLSHPLQTFTVALLPSQPACMVDISSDPAEAARWTIQSIHVAPEYAAAFALRAKITGAVLDFHPTYEVTYASL